MTLSTVARRYRLTGKIPNPKADPRVLELGQGWTTTDLVLRAADLAAAATAEGTFTFAELQEAVRQIMVAHAIQFTGATSQNRYKDDAARIAHGRFGDLHRSGVFQAL